MSPHKQDLASARRVLMIAMTCLAIIVFIAGFFVSRVDEMSAASRTEPASTRAVPTPLPDDRIQFAPVLVTPADLTAVGAGKIELKGTGPAGFRLRVLIDNRDVGETIIDDKNDWRVTIELSRPGTYEFTLATVTLDDDIVALSPVMRLTISEFE